MAEGPVPFFHDYFSCAKGPLHDDFPAPDKVAVSCEKLFSNNKFSVGGSVDANRDKTIDTSVSTEVNVKGDEVTAGLKVDLTGFAPLAGRNGIVSGLEKAISPSVKIVCPTKRHCVNVDMEKISLDWTHPTFSFHARTNFWDGGIPVHASLSTCVCKNTFAGVCWDYDALRSGLRHAVVAVNHKCNDCESTVSVDGLWNIGLTNAVNVLGNKNLRMFVDVMPAKSLYVGGLEYSSDEDTRGMMRVDVGQKMLSLAAFFKAGAAATVGVSSSWTKGEQGVGLIPQVGVSVNF